MPLTIKISSGLSRKNGVEGLLIFLMRRLFSTIVDKKRLINRNAIFNEKDDCNDMENH